MVSHPFKSTLRKLSWIGGVALLVGLLSLGSMPQPVQSATNAQPPLFFLGFESPQLNNADKRVMSPYQSGNTSFMPDADFAPRFDDKVVGLVKNSATSACVESEASDDQTLGTGRRAFDNGAVGGSAFPIEAHFNPAFRPSSGSPVRVSVDIQSGLRETAQLELYGRNGNLLATSKRQINTSDGTCGYPGGPSGTVRISATSPQPVSLARMTIAGNTASGGSVFVIDDFEVLGSHGPSGSDLNEDCIAFDPNRAQVQQVNGRWKIVVGDMWLLDFGDSRQEAQQALTIIQSFGFNDQCFVGRPDPSMEYYLVDDQAPSGSITGEDCVGFNPNRIEVRNVNGSWKIVEDDHWIMDFGNKRDEAEKAFELIQTYNFNQICFVGRPDPSMTYFKSGGSASGSTASATPLLKLQADQALQDALQVSPSDLLAGSIIRGLIVNLQANSSTAYHVYGRYFANGQFQRDGFSGNFQAQPGDNRLSFDCQPQPSTGLPMPPCAVIQDFLAARSSTTASMAVYVPDPNRYANAQYVPGDNDNFMPQNMNRDLQQSSGRSPILFLSATPPNFQADVAARPLIITRRGAQPPGWIRPSRSTGTEVPDEPPLGGELRANVTTNRGCLESTNDATFAVGDSITVRFSWNFNEATTGGSQTALVTLVDILPSGERQTLIERRVPSGQTQTLRGSIGPPSGVERLQMRVSYQNGELTGQAQCSFRVTQGESDPVEGPEQPGRDDIPQGTTTLQPGSPEYASLISDYNRNVNTFDYQEAASLTIGEEGFALLPGISENNTIADVFQRRGDTAVLGKVQTFRGPMVVTILEGSINVVPNPNTGSGGGGQPQPTLNPNPPPNSNQPPAVTIPGNGAGMTIAFFMLLLILILLFI